MEERVIQVSREVGDRLLRTMPEGAVAPVVSRRVLTEGVRRRGEDRHPIPAVPAPSQASLGVEVPPLGAARSRGGASAASGTWRIDQNGEVPDERVLLHRGHRVHFADRSETRVLDSPEPVEVRNAQDGDEAPDEEPDEEPPSVESIRSDEEEVVPIALENEEQGPSPEELEKNGTDQGGVRTGAAR